MHKQVLAAVDRPSWRCRQYVDSIQSGDDKLPLQRSVRRSLYHAKRSCQHSVINWTPQIRIGRLIVAFQPRQLRQGRLQHCYRLAGIVQQSLVRPTRERQSPGLGVPTAQPQENTDDLCRSELLAGAPQEVHHSIGWVTHGECIGGL